MLRTIGADRVIDYAQEDFTDGPETYDVIFDVVRNTPSGRMVQVADGERMPAHGQSGLHADRSRQVGFEGEQEAGVVRGHRAERARTWPTCEAWSKRGSCARSSTGASHWSRWSRLTGTPRPGRSWGTSSSPLRSRGRDRQLLGVERLGRTEGNTMKAVIQTGYGSADVMELRELEKPAPGDGEVLVRVLAASPCRRRVLRDERQAVPDPVLHRLPQAQEGLRRRDSIARGSSRRSART